jgi:hypothetical protein
MTFVNSYHARLDPYTVHELVRHDPGVISVMRDFYHDEEPIAVDGEESEDIQKEEPKPSLLRRWYPQTISSAYWYNMMISAGTKLSTPLPDYGDRVSFRNVFHENPITYRSLSFYLHKPVLALIFISLIPASSLITSGSVAALAISKEWV